MKSIGVACIMTIALGTALAQPDSTADRAPVYQQKNFELGLSGGFVHVSIGPDGEGSGILTLTPRVGRFIWRGLEGEVEGYIVAPSTGDAYYAVNGLVSYNFPLQGHAMLFLLVGYGFGNLVPMGSLVGQSFESTTLELVNLGGGLKIHAADNVAIRVEARQLRATGDQPYHGYVIAYGGGSNPTMRVDLRVFSVLFGFSLFF